MAHIDTKFLTKEFGLPYLVYRIKGLIRAEKSERKRRKDVTIITKKDVTIIRKNVTHCAAAAATVEMAQYDN